MTKPQMTAGEKALDRTGYIHIAFRLGSKQAVDELTQRLRDDGYPVASGPRMTGDGYYESCIKGTALDTFCIWFFLKSIDK